MKTPLLTSVGRGVFFVVGSQGGFEVIVVDVSPARCFKGYGTLTQQIHAAKIPDAGAWETGVRR